MKIMLKTVLQEYLLCPLVNNKTAKNKSFVIYYQPNNIPTALCERHSYHSLHYENCKTKIWYTKLSSQINKTSVSQT